MLAVLRAEPSAMPSRAESHAAAMLSRAETEPAALLSRADSRARFDAEPSQNRASCYAEPCREPSPPLRCASLRAMPVGMGFLVNSETNGLSC